MANNSKTVVEYVWLFLAINTLWHGLVLVEHNTLDFIKKGFSHPFLNTKILKITEIVFPIHRFLHNRQIRNWGQMRLCFYDKRKKIANKKIDSQFLSLYSPNRSYIKFKTLFKYNWMIFIAFFFYRFHRVMLQIQTIVIEGIRVRYG